MKRFWNLVMPLQMPDVDYGVWGAKAGVNPPGGMVGPVLASTTTLAPTHPIHHVSGTSAINTITVPYTGFVGTITLIADAAWTLATGGTDLSDISTAVTMVANQAIDLVYDGDIWIPKIAD